MKQKILVEGDENLLEQNEILVTEKEGYTILRERLETGKLKTFVVIPLEDFPNRKKVKSEFFKKKEDNKQNK